MIENLSNEDTSIKDSDLPQKSNLDQSINNTFIHGKLGAAESLSGLIVHGLENDVPNEVAKGAGYLLLNLIQARIDEVERSD